MRLRRTRVRRRDGFTLIELLIVIGIIAILASLTTSAVFAAFTKMREVKCRNEISDLSNSMKQMESDYNITVPPPSRLWLDETGTYSTVPAGVPAGTTLAQLAQLAVDSEAYVKKVWPRHQYPIDWNGNGTIDNQGVVLEGSQVLVFFLGGARNSSGAFIGFSADPTNPMNTNAAIKRKGPYFQFVAGRVQPLNGSSTYPAYFDTYSNSPALAGDMPYAYFSSGKSANGYSPYANNPALGASDCPSLVGFNAANQAGLVLPYFQPAAAGQPIVFFNSDTFQIISAGKNQIFGAGGAWTLTTGSQVGKAGLDDLSNFGSTRLGAPQ
jgi:prepilin-type N-terminal cleavage/methylation domain-containing protein